MIVGLMVYYLIHLGFWPASFHEVARLARCHNELGKRVSHELGLARTEPAHCQTYLNDTI